MTPQTLLTVENLTLQAGASTLLRNFDWRVRAGEFWCVLGKNGIGKSTLLHAVAGLLQPAQGHVFAPHGDIARSTPLQLARWRGLVAQQQFDAFSCRVIDSVMQGLHPYRSGWGWSDAADRDAAFNALRQLDMEAHADADVMALSGGERQRVAMAMLMLQAPQLYLLDEPASHQDVASQQKVMRLMHDLADAQHAVVATMHDINLAARFATHVLLIWEGGCLGGVADEVLTTDFLHAAFGCRFDVMQTSGRSWFVPV